MTADDIEVLPGVTNHTSQSVVVFLMAAVPWVLVGAVAAPGVLVRAAAVPWILVDTAADAPGVLVSPSLPACLSREQVCVQRLRLYLVVNLVCFC